MYMLYVIVAFVCIILNVAVIVIFVDFTSHQPQTNDSNTTRPFALYLGNGSKKIWILRLYCCCYNDVIIVVVVME